MSTRRALTYLGSHLGARESRPNRLAAAAAGVAGLQAGLWPALGKLWRGAGAALVTGREDFLRGRGVYFCLGGTHDGVGRVGLGPPVGFFPLFTPEFSQHKKKFSRGNHTVSTLPKWVI